MRMDEIDNNKKFILELLEEHHGIVTTACKSLGLARATFYKWCNDDPNFKEAVEEITETAIDFVESKLMEKINGVTVLGQKDVIYEQPPSDTAIIFYLKTKGKKRGYVERSEIDHTTKGESINPTPITFTKKNG